MFLRHPWPNARNMLRPCSNSCDMLCWHVAIVWPGLYVWFTRYVMQLKTNKTVSLKIESFLKERQSIEFFSWRQTIFRCISVYCPSDISNVFGNTFLFPDFFMFLFQLLLYYMHQHKIGSHNYFLYGAIYNKKITSALHQLDGRFIDC